MPKAVFNKTTIADFDDIILLEGNYYFPPESVDMQYLHLSDTSTVCSWKGMAIYYDVIVGGQKNPNAAWAYHKPSKAAKSIKGHIAFGEGVEIKS